MTAAVSSPHIMVASLKTELDGMCLCRMAMAFSLAACASSGIVINDPGCTRKTFPKYFEVLRSVSQ